MNITKSALLLTVILTTLLTQSQAKNHCDSSLSNLETKVDVVLNLIKKKADLATIKKARIKSDEAFSIVDKNCNGAVSQQESEKLMDLIAKMDSYRHYGDVKSTDPKKIKCEKLVKKIKADSHEDRNAIIEMVDKALVICKKAGYEKSKWKKMEEDLWIEVEVCGE